MKNVQHHSHYGDAEQIHITVASHKLEKLTKVNVGDGVET